MCVTKGVDPVSSISDDGRTLVCNLGAVKMGTAVVVQTPIVADGQTGDQITATGAINGQTAELSPIEIRNTFGMDILWGTPTNSVLLLGDGDYAFDFEWTLFQDRGSDAGPDTVSYDLSIPLGTGQPLELGQQANYEPFNHPCVHFQNSASAPGHPYSGGWGAPERNAPFVENCSLVKTGPTTFRLTLSGIDYSQTQVPTHDSAGDPLPTDKVAIASGAIWLRVNNLTQSTSAVLTSSAPTYRSVTGQTVTDDPANNTTSKVITMPGTWSHPWLRSSGSWWDNALKQPPGAQWQSLTNDYIGSTSLPAGAAVGDCDVLDARYVDFVSADLLAWRQGDPAAKVEGLGRFQYYVGNDPTVTPGSGGYDPNAFRGCGATTGWVDTVPADKTAVKAVRWLANHGDLDGRLVVLRVNQTIQADAPVGQDIWSWGAGIRDGAWVYYGRSVDGGERLAPVPGGRYPYTTHGRDVLHVVFAVPAVRKAADRSVVKPGEPANFTLTYSANGAGPSPRRSTTTGWWTPCRSA